MSAILALSGNSAIAEVHILAIDLAKRRLQVCANDRIGAIVVFKRWRRALFFTSGALC
jgi:hypothetical protein